jgi:hypothetical protein
MRRDRVILTAVSITAVLLAVLAVLLCTGYIPTAHQDTGTVATFNDGFATSKQDDCQQGSAYACAWLHDTH